MRVSKLLIGVSALLASAAAFAQAKWDMPTPYSDGTFHTKNARQFVQEATKGGKLQITVHSNGSLIKHPEIKRAVQTGQVPIGEILISVLANENPLFAFDSNPFFANGYDKEKKLWTIARPYIEKRLDAQGIKILYSVPWPPQALWAKKQINSIADMKGLKFRTYSPTTSRLAELVGAIPTTVQLPEVPQAFRTGVVDLMITSSSGGVDTQAWDYLTHFYDTEAFLPHNVVFVNKAAFAKLDAASQKALVEAGARAEERGWKMSQEDNAQAIKTLAAKGIKVAKPDAKLAAEFAAIGKTISQEWAKRAGSEGEAILKAYSK
ncbi:MAG TPA: TRAP transporter substrate-binding protein [Burkholderiales bacterium]|jgi:TRAP-type C4-dicarboxylate transport system substrate-binding protein|nr:TRAP transporter substrate-binding protein [Burkholderiales bacterium]